MSRTFVSWCFRGPCLVLACVLWLTPNAFAETRAIRAVGVLATWLTSPAKIGLARWQVLQLLRAKISSVSGDESYNAGGTSTRPPTV